jgi:DNA adenine methylase
MRIRTRNEGPVSPLRYPGAKRWMTGYIARALDQNNMMPGVFVEPFAGGASVALAQLYRGLVKTVILNDRDPLVAAFWHTTFFDTDWLIDEIWKAEISLNNWKRLKSQRPLTKRALAFKCLFLNRTSFSGILTDQAGPIGGQSQTSKYKIDCRFTKETVIGRIEYAAKFNDRVAAVWNLPWHSAIARVQRMQSRGSLPPTALYFLDPPFYRKASLLYKHHFNHAQHVALRDFLTKFDEPWILSYDSCPEILSLYRQGGMRASQVNLIYTAGQSGKKGIGKELIVSNLPRMVSELQMGVGRTASNAIPIKQVKAPPAEFGPASTMRRPSGQPQQPECRESARPPNIRRTQKKDFA